MENVLLFTTLLLTLVLITAIAGIVWRVEKLLDVSYKFLLAASIIFGIWILMDILVLNKAIPDIGLGIYFRALFAVLFTFAVLEMRILVRRLDGELTKKKAKKK